MCFCFFVKHRIFHVLLFIGDITVAKEHLIKFKPDQSSARFIRSSCILIGSEPDWADQPNQVCVTP